MRLLPAKLMLLVSLLVAGHLVPTLHAFVSCCGGAAPVAIDAPGELERTDATASGCCQHLPEDSQPEPGPVDAPLCPTPDQPEAPCDEDCSCTLCRASAFSAFQVESGGMMIHQFHRDERLPFDQSSFRSRDQRFDLLRPPQL